MRIFLAYFLVFFTVFAASAQGTFYTVKGGLTLGLQQWNGFDREALPAYHGALAIESFPIQGRFSLLAQAGYHQKGSTIRRTLFGNPFNSGFIGLPPQKFVFHNLSLLLAAKQRIGDIDPGKARLFYMFGIRGDFTMDTNLDEYEAFVEANPNIAGAYPINVYYSQETLLGVRRINYGFSAGAGLEIPISEFVEGLFEFSVNPDFSYQYEQPTIPNVYNPFNNTTTTIPERKIRNLTFELSVGLRFLRKVVYID